MNHTTFSSLRILRVPSRPFAVFLLLLVFLVPASAQDTALPLRGAIVDSETGAPLEGRLYVESLDDGRFHLARSVGGDAVPYEKTRGETSVEIHTSLSAHPFEALLPPGSYRLTAERGKEFLPAIRQITLPGSDAGVTLPLRRWIDMESLGWYSGETHIHRSLAELPLLMRCEDLNVAFPLTYWVNNLEDTPLKNNRNQELIPPAELITVDGTRVIWPVNTEYEITSVGRQPHVLGALFVLGHKEPLDISAPPVSQVAIQARLQQGLLDLDKHNWPWSLAIVPAISVDLFELTNNHLWRTAFAFKDFHLESLPEYMNIERDAEGGYTERGWIDFGFQTWYALLNCGIDIKPSAGTASGVHPVPLGFGRVYVKLEGPFNYDSWIAGLREGRSFVTTGPMLAVQFNGLNPGAFFELSPADNGSVRVAGQALAIEPIESVEIIVNGEIARTIPAAAGPGGDAIVAVPFDVLVPVKESSWIAVRAFTKSNDGRPRFAHSAPVHIEIPGKPQRARRVEVEHLAAQVRAVIERNRDVLPPKALAEFRRSLTFYEAQLETAR